MFRTLAVAIFALAASPAFAATSCPAMIADLRAWLDANPDVSGTRMQTKEAQTQHQPTAASVAKAKMQSRDHLVELLGEAEAKQREGDMVGCEATLGDVERMLKP